MLRDKENESFFLDYKVQIRVTAHEMRVQLGIEVLLESKKSKFLDNPIGSNTNISSEETKTLPIKFEYLKEHFPSAVKTLIKGLIMEAHYRRFLKSQKEVLEKKLIRRQTRALKERMGKNKKGRPKTSNKERIEFMRKIISTLEYIELHPEEFKGKKILSQANVARLIYPQNADPRKELTQKLESLNVEFRELLESYSNKKEKLLKKNTDNKSE
jgi:hypothetical protein